MNPKSWFTLVILYCMSVGCQAAFEVGAQKGKTKQPALVQENTAGEEGGDPQSVAAKLTMVGCLDPDLTKLVSTEIITLCDGTRAKGQLVISDNIIKSGEIVAGITGSFSDAIADCKAEGEVGCKTTDTMRSVQTMGLASKVLFSEVVAGVSGNVSLPAPADVLFGSGTYGSSDAPLLPQLTNQGDWDMELAFPGAGYFSSVSNMPAASEICNSATFNGALGDANCDGMAAFTHHDIGAQVSIGEELATSTSALPAGYRDVPMISQDDYGPPSSASVNAVVRNSVGEWEASTPKLVCGKGEPSIGAKIEACDTAHNAGRPSWDLTSGDKKLMWDGAVQGNASEGAWTLISIYHPSLSNDATCDSSCTEIWQDERTGYIWSDMLSNGGTLDFNWCHATGSNNNDKTGNPYAEIDAAGYCDSTTYQLQDYVANGTLPISLCAENADFLDTPAWTNGGKGDMRLGTTPAVRWKLPTVHDMAQAILVNGGYYVMPNMNNYLWSSSIRSTSRSQAWYFNGTSGIFNIANRFNDYVVRCVGRS